MATRECYIRDVIALENVEPEKKKGTLGKIADRGGVFGCAVCRANNTPTKNFLKKIVYKANTAVSKKTARYLINRSPIQVLEWDSYSLALYIFYRRRNLCKLDRMGIVMKMKVPFYMVLI